MDWRVIFLLTRGKVWREFEFNVGVLTAERFSCPCYIISCLVFPLSCLVSLHPTLEIKRGLWACLDNFFHKRLQEKNIRRENGLSFSHKKFKIICALNIYRNSFY